MLKNTLRLSLSILLIFGVSISQVIAQNNLSLDKKIIGNQSAKQTAWLGIWIENVPIALGTHLSSMLQENQGVLISRVHENSPAQQMGLKKYDVIAQLNDQKIFSSQQLSQLIHNAEVDSKMVIHYVQQGKMHSKEVILSLKPQKDFLPQIKTNRIQPLLPQGFNPFRHPGFNFQNFSNKLQKNTESLSWSEFESLLIQSTEPNKYHVSVTYQDSNNEKKEFTFEGNMQQIQQQISSTAEMDENKKSKLLAALGNQGNINYSFQHGFFPAPDWFNQNQPLFPLRFGN